MKKLFLFMCGLAISCGVLAEQRHKAEHKYSQELEDAFDRRDSQLARTALVGNGTALALLRVAQWRAYLAQTQHREPSVKDKVGFFFMENEVANFADRCYALPPAEVPLLYAAVTEYAGILSMPVPFILLVDDNKLFDASAASFTHASGFLILSRGLFNHTSEREFLGVIAHEMGRIMEREQAKMMLYFTPLAVVGFVAMLFCLKKILDNTPTFSPRQMVGSLALMGGYGIISILYWCALSRKQEQLADFAAAQIDPLGGVAMIEALERGMKQMRGDDLGEAKEMIEEMGDLAVHDRLKMAMKLSSMQSMQAEACNAGAHELGIFGTRRPLVERKRFFRSVV